MSLKPVNTVPVCPSARSAAVVDNITTVDSAGPSECRICNRKYFLKIMFNSYAKYKDVDCSVHSVLEISGHSSIPGLFKLFSHRFPGRDTGGLHFEGQWCPGSVSQRGL